MKLATHNSLSFHRPQWWLIPFNWMAKCQNLTIQQQYERGVRLFDIRIKIIDDKLYSSHGIATYKVKFPSLFAYLNHQRDCTVRLLLESGDEELFKSYAENLPYMYINIRFVGGQRKKDWVKVADLPDFSCTDYYWKHRKWWMIPYPQRYAKKYNQKNKEFINNDVWSMFDFIDI
ncbi:hypothetical protein [Bacteroides sp. AF16-49]|uniref:hypothetical protein n=1 Tax=Bacteroides sp. AF16-49 TaxID=2292192 RepID=UPI000F008378|nr:hypothetical protein [Bacteroides sp. AF16-49]